MYMYGIVISRYEVEPYEIFIFQTPQGDLITLKVSEYEG